MCISGNWSISVPFYPKAGKLLQRRICQLGKQRHFGEGEEGLSWLFSEDPCIYEGRAEENPNPKESGANEQKAKTEERIGTVGLRKAYREGTLEWKLN